MPVYALGKDCLAYRNTGTYGSPTWSAVGAVKDVNLTSAATKWDGSRRAVAYKQYVPTLKDLGVTFNLVYQPADAGAGEAIRDAHFAGTIIDMAFASGAIATSGTEYMRSEWGVFGFNRNEGLEDGVTVDVELAPYVSANAPTYTEVT